MHGDDAEIGSDGNNSCWGSGIMNEELERLKRHQTDHLILLVGTNPLPNYVAAQLLVKPGGTVHLLCSDDTEEIAKRLEGKLSQLSLQTQCHPNLNEGHPADIYQKTHALAESLKGTLGLHYTGGTKAMSVHAYRAVKQVEPGTVCSYLDAKALRIVIDGGMKDGRDDTISVGKAVLLSVKGIADLHNVEFADAKDSPLLLQVSRELQADFELSGQWRKWAKENLMTPQDNHKPRPSTELRVVRAPASEFPKICQAFANLGAPTDAIEDWAKATNHFKINSDGLKKFADWLAGGYWLESITLDALLHIKKDCQLDDCGMGYVADESKFEFDVAATRGYQLFAISCTTDASTTICKSKLFEAYARAKQMGGDEARTALVCYYRDPQALLAKFKSENYFAEGSVKVFGVEDLKDLATNLKLWIINN